jgi:hypothetical protein
MQPGRGRRYGYGSFRVVERWRSSVSCASAALCSILLLANCEVATKPPKVESRLMFPSATATFAVTELLPSSVQVVGSNFRIQLPPATLTTRSLAEMCGALCPSLPWLNVPKPGFTDSIEVSLSLDSDLVGVTLTDGALALALTHGLGFDPLHPAGAERTGSLRVSARSGDHVIGTLLIDEPFPSGETLHRTVTLAPGDVTGELALSIMLDSPLGTKVPVDSLLRSNTAFQASMTQFQVDAAEVRVRLIEKPINTEQISVDLSGVEQNVIRRLRGGAARITVDNPFEVSGTFELRLQHSGIDVRRTAQIGPGRSTTRVELTDVELQALLGHSVTMTLSGTVNAAGPFVTVRPGQNIGITTTVELLVEIP